MTGRDVPVGRFAALAGCDRAAGQRRSDQGRRLPRAQGPDVRRAAQPAGARRVRRGHPAGDPQGRRPRVYDGGQPILCRFTLSDITKTTAKWRQVFSTDDGKTWPTGIWTPSACRSGSRMTQASCCRYVAVMVRVLRVATWNVNHRGPALAKSLGGLLRRSRVDLVMVQEANRTSLEALAEAAGFDWTVNAFDCGAPLPTDSPGRRRVVAVAGRGSPPTTVGILPDLAFRSACCLPPWRPRSGQ